MLGSPLFGVVNADTGKFFISIHLLRRQCVTRSYCGKPVSTGELVAMGQETYTKQPTLGISWANNGSTNESEHDTMSSLVTEPTARKR